MDDTLDRTARRIVRWESGVAREIDDEVADEQPLEIRVRGRGVSVTMRTPGHDNELAAGFCLTEGIIQCAGDLHRVEHCGRNEFGNVINIQLSPLIKVDFERLTRHVFASSSCGLCGKATLEAIGTRWEPIGGDGLVVSSGLLAELPEKMRQSQATFERTGGLHAAAIFDASGRMIVLREDVGRHNAVDKVLGFALMNKMLPLEKNVLLVSGRTSFEIMQKSLAGRVPIVAAVSAPSSLAVEFARENRQTLVGFLRKDRMNVYSGEQRVKFE